MRAVTSTEAENGHKRLLRKPAPARFCHKFFKRSFTHTQTHNRAHIVTLALLNLATVLSRCNKCLRAEAWEVFPQIRDAASVSDYLSAVMELCSLRLSRSLFSFSPCQPQGTITAFFFCLSCDIFFSSKRHSPPLRCILILCPDNASIKATKSS